MKKILVIIKDWKTRSLLAAELQEEGYQTFLTEDIRDAIVALRTARVKPALVILDTLGQDVNPDLLGELHTLVGSVPWLICTGALGPISPSDLPGPFHHFLTRPVSIGTIIDRAKQLLRP